MVDTDHSTPVSGAEDRVVVEQVDCDWLISAFENAGAIATAKALRNGELCMLNSRVVVDALAAYRHRLAALAQTPDGAVAVREDEADRRRLSMAEDQLTSALNLRGSGVPAGRWGWAMDHGCWLLDLAKRALAVPAISGEGEKLREALPTDAQVREAMQTAWDDFCDDAQAIPGDIYRKGRKTFFRAGTWAAHTAMHLRAALATPDALSPAGLKEEG